MSQKFQMITLLAMVGSLGSSGAVQATLAPGTCESFVGIKMTKCFLNSGDCYPLADGTCNPKKPEPCEHEKRQSPQECDKSNYTKSVYKDSNCHWGTIPIKIGEKDVVVGHRQVGTGKKDKNKNEIMKTEDIMGKEDIMGTKPACVKG